MKPLDELEARLLAQIGELERSIADLRQKLSGVHEARAALLGIAPAEQSPPAVEAKARQNIKKVAMEVIADFGDRGFTALDVVMQAAARERIIKVDSVRSMLSRLKADGALRFDDGKYFNGKAAPASVPSWAKQAA